MTEDPKPGRRPSQSEFDLVEDIGDAAAFDRALDELLPRGDLGSGGRFDIDPADFEAFNRELDAQMAQAKARSARIEIIEDLGTDVVESPPGWPPRETALPVPERIGSGFDEPQVPDDVVTLGPAAAPVAATPAVAEPPAADIRSTPATPAPPPPATAPTPPGRPVTLAVLLGLGGLLAGAAGLWLSFDRQAEVTRLRSSLAERQAPTTAPAVPASSVDAEKVRALEGRLEEVTRRLAELSAAPAPAPAPAPAEVLHKPALADTHAPPREPAAAAAAPAPTTATTASPTPPTSAPAAEAVPATAPAPPTLPKPSGHGSWAVVIDSFKEEPVAEQRSAQLARMGLPAEVRWYTANDQMRYRVVVPGYATREAADAAAAELRRRKAGGAWVTRLPKQE